jgi:hypothetical protein
VTAADRDHSPPPENLRARITALEADREAAEAERRELRQAVELLSRLLTRAGYRLAAAEAPRQRSEKFVTLAEAAARSGLSQRTVKRMVERGVLEGRALLATGKTRRRWVVELASLETLLSAPVR